MSIDERRYRLDGLEPGNLLAFLALLGLLHALEESEPTWLPKVAWTVDELPVRPALSLSSAVSAGVIAATAADGVTRLAERHDFGPLKDLRLSPENAAEQLAAAGRSDDAYNAELWAALVSDAAVRERNKAEETEPTPLCLMFGQGHQHFLERLRAVPRAARADRGSGRSKAVVSAEDCLAEALFAPWARPDAMPSFRWDLHEDVRYALRATDPTNVSTKETTQHGANRLAAVGLAALTVVPERRAGNVRLGMLGGSRDAGGAFTFTWPIWRKPIGLTAIRALLGHPGLDDPDTRRALGVVDRQRSRRISVGRYMNFTQAVSLDA